MEREPIKSVEQFPELQKGSIHHGRLMKAYSVLEEERLKRLSQVRGELREIQGIKEPEQPKEYKQVALFPTEGIIFETGKQHR